MKTLKIIENLHELEDMLYNMIAHFEGVLDGEIDDPALSGLTRKELTRNISDLNDVLDEACDICYGLATGNFEDHERARAIEIIEFWGIE